MEMRIVKRRGVLSNVARQTGSTISVWTTIIVKFASYAELH